MEQLDFGDERAPAGVIVLPELCEPALWPLACLISQVEANRMHGDLTGCSTCGYPMYDACLNCQVHREPVPRPVVVWPTHGVVKVPFVCAEGWFLRDTQRAWVQSRGLARACVTCKHALANGQERCLICIARQLYI